MDTPTGATIVVTFGAVLVAMFMLHLVVHRGGNGNVPAVAHAAPAEVHSTKLEV
jgi:hypothetical protein